MQNALLVGMGGFIGSVLRYLLNSWVYSLVEYPLFPWGILIVNILGCLFIGIIGGLAETREILTSSVRIFLMIGVLGGFTTFSSFGYDTFGLMRSGQLYLAAANVLLQVFLGLGAVWIGFLCARII